MVTRTQMHVRGGLVAAAAAALVMSAASSPVLADVIGFNYPDFSNVSTLNIVGTAGPLNTGSGFAMMLTPATGRQAGAIWHRTKVNVAAGFETTFQIRVDQINGGGADGFAFVIQNSSGTALGGDGGGLGYGANPMFGGQGIANSLAVELDMWNNSPANWSDMDDHHVAIHSMGLLPNSPVQGDATIAAESLATGAKTVNLADGATHTVVVNYVPPVGLGPGIMSVFLNDLVTPVLVTALNLDTLLALDEGTAWVGITAATGNVLDAQRQAVHSWSFASAIPGPGAGSLLGLAGLMALRRRRRFAQ